jgi:hypothetical protein
MTTTNTYPGKQIGTYPKSMTSDTPTAGTVTSVSVNPSNGFNGSVSNPTTTPAISIQTNVTGILKGNGVAVSAATGPDIITSNVLSLAGRNLKSTIDGVDSNTVVIPSGGATTNTLINNNDNTLTSTVDGLSSTAGIVETNVLNLTGVTLKSTVNSIDSNTISVQPLISSPTANDIVYTDGAGKVIDSGISVTTSATSNDNTHVMTSATTQTAITNAITADVSLRGQYDASTNLFPTTGGSGPAGGVAKGDYWFIQVGGSPGGVSVVPGNTITALVLIPGQTSSNWFINRNSGVLSFKGRSGVVVPATGDYTIAQVTNGLTNVASSANVLIGNASNIATPTAVTGDISINNTGVTALQNVPTGVATTLASGVVHSNGAVLSSSLIVDADVSATAAIATTKLAALTANGAVSSDASGKLAATALTNGQLIVGSTGTAPVATTLTGTANEIIVTNTAGSVTFSTPQAIATTSTPTFAEVTITGTPTNPTDTATKGYVDTGLALKAPLASPALAGIPTAPTAAPGTNTSQLATTSFVAASSAAGVTSFNTRTGAVTPLTGDYAVGQVIGAAPLASPTFTGTLTAPNITSSNISVPNTLTLGYGGSLLTVNPTGKIIAADFLNNLNGYKLSWASATTLGLALGTCSLFGTGLMMSQAGNVVINIANVGVVNGLDTGSAVNNTSYYVYAIFHTTPSLNGGLLSTNASTPTLPSGYIASRYIGKVRYATGAFLKFVQTGNSTTRKITYTDSTSTTQVLAGGSSTTFVAISLSSFLSLRSTTGIIRYDFDSGAGASSYISIRETGSVVAAPLIAFCAGVASSNGKGLLPFICNTSQSIDYALSVAGSACNFYVQSFEEEL